MIQLTRTGTVVSASSRDLERLREEFDRQHCVRVPAFLAPDLCHFTQSELERATFTERVHRRPEPGAPADHAVWARDLTVEEPLAKGAFHVLLMNDATLFAAVRSITGCGPIGSFVGALYRMHASDEHYDSWHHDCAHSRMIAVSINLSSDVYSGGVLQIRERESGAIVHEVANTGVGDAIVFRVSPDLEHRVTAVKGAVAKTAYAGWFCSEPVFDLLSEIHQPAQPSP